VGDEVTGKDGEGKGSEIDAAIAEAIAKRWHEDKERVAGKLSGILTPDPETKQVTLLLLEVFGNVAVFKEANDTDMGVRVLCTNCWMEVRIRDQLLFAEVVAQKHVCDGRIVEV
jgi:hypothetical protein